MPSVEEFEERLKKILKPYAFSRIKKKMAEREILLAERDRLFQVSGIWAESMILHTVIVEWERDEFALVCSCRGWNSGVCSHAFLVLRHLYLQNKLTLDEIEEYVKRRRKEIEEMKINGGRK